LKLGQLPPRFLQEGGQPLDLDDAALEDFRRIPDWISPIPAKQLEKTMLQRAQKGDVEAQFWLGSFYRTGDDAIKKNSQFALRWLKEAAAQGDPIACYDLATMHRNGDGTAKDPSAALMFLTAAAAEGYLPAMYGVAEMYAQGLGAPQDQEKALGWMISAARAGYQPAVDLLKEKGISTD
jgi:TPR repeat protein